jgi:histidinol-phosphatase (PHP family)
VLLPADYHMHTHLCHHAEGVPLDLARRAVALGIQEIGISEHNPMPRDDFDDWRMERSRLEEYLEAVAEARREHPGLVIRAALEVDYLPGLEDWIRELSALYPWDYFIGSVHYLDGGWDIDNPKKLSHWRTRDVDDVWAAYFERLTAAAESGLFHIIGHPDLPKKFGYRPVGDVTPVFAGFLDAAARSGVAIEINTAGLRKECREMYPGSGFLRMAAERGVGLTFGSDAHQPGEVGMNFGEAVALARSCGYRESRVYQGGRWVTVPLPRPAGGT